jgi:hypothetical protein
MSKRKHDNFAELKQQLKDLEAKIEAAIPGVTARSQLRGARMENGQLFTVPYKQRLAAYEKLVDQADQLRYKLPLTAEQQKEGLKETDDEYTRETHTHTITWCDNLKMKFKNNLIKI